MGFLQEVEAAPELPITAVLQVAPTPRSNSSDNGTSVALIGGIIAAAVAAVVLLALLAFFAIRRHRRAPPSGRGARSAASGTTAASSLKTGASYTVTSVRAAHAVLCYGPIDAHRHAATPHDVIGPCIHSCNRNTSASPPNIIPNHNGHSTQSTFHACIPHM